MPTTPLLRVSLSIALATAATPLARSTPLQSSDYELELLTLPGGPLQLLFSATSIDDSGRVAFVASEAGQQKLLLASAPGQITMISAVPGSSYTGVGLSSGGQARVASVEQSAGAYHLRSWPASSGGSPVLIGQSPGDFASAVGSLDIDDSGVVVAPALITAGTGLASVLLAGSSQPPAVLETFTTAIPLHPLMSRTQGVVVRDGLGEIVIYQLPGAAKTRIAGAAEGFSQTGSKPGISEDGRTVVFAGKRSPLVGVYASLTSPSGRHIVRLAGEEHGDVDDVELDSRVAVSSRMDGFYEHITVVFHGRQGTTDGLFSVRFTVQAAQDGTPIVTGGLVRRVVSEGDVVEGRTVASVQTHDPVNRDGSIAFQLVFTDFTRAVARARPTGPAWASTGRTFPVTTLRVSLKRVLGPSGAPNAFWTAGNLSSVQRTINRLLNRRALSGLEIRIVETVDVPDPGTGASSWFDVDVANAASMEAAANPPQGPPQHGWNPSAINVYLVNSLYEVVQGGTNALCGHCSNPVGCGTTSEIVLIPPVVCGTPNLLNDVTVTLAHELGHYLGLHHTFSASCNGQETGLIQCLVAPASCQVSGDLACDTAFDPNSGLSQLQSLYQGCNPVVFNQLRYNLMSYYPGIGSGTVTLTGQQVGRMRSTALQFRAHVIQ